MHYVANDGTVFDDVDDCFAYERDKAFKSYHEKWVDPHLDVRANNVIKLFQEACRKGRRSDDFLICEGYEPRYENKSYTVRMDMGIINLRDDLVDILIMRIRELEGKPVYNARKA